MMEGFNENQQLAIKIIEACKMEIYKGEKTFSILKDGIKMYGFSSYDYLTPEQVLKTISSAEFGRGFRAGKEALKNELHNLLKPNN